MACDVKRALRTLVDLLALVDLGSLLFKQLISLFAEGQDIGSFNSP